MSKRQKQSEAEQLRRTGQHPDKARPVALIRQERADPNTRADLWPRCLPGWRRPGAGLVAELLARAYRPRLACVLIYCLPTLQIPPLPLPSIPVGSAPSQVPLSKVWTAHWPRSHLLHPLHPLSHHLLGLLLPPHSLAHLLPFPSPPQSTHHLTMPSP